jgi:hypothetical protein
VRLWNLFPLGGLKHVHLWNPFPLGGLKKCVPVESIPPGWPYLWNLFSLGWPQKCAPVALLAPPSNPSFHLGWPIVTAPDHPTNLDIVYKLGQAGEAFIVRSPTFKFIPKKLSFCVTVPFQKYVASLSETFYSVPRHSRRHLSRLSHLSRLTPVSPVTSSPVTPFLVSPA